MKTKAWFFVGVTLIITWMAIIFIFSRQVKEESRNLSLKVTNGIINLMPKERQKQYEENKQMVKDLNVIVRKTAHFAIYFLGGVLVTAFLSTITDLNYKKILLLATLFGILYASLDEIHQYFVAGRGAEVTDVMLDSIGYIIAELITLGIIAKSRRKKEKENG